MRARRVQRFDLCAGHAGAVEGHEAQACAVAPAALCDHHRKVRDVAVRHGQFRSSHGAVGVGSCEAVRRRLSGTLGEGERADGVAGGDFRQPGLPLRIASGQQQRFRRQVDRRREGHGRNDTAEFLRDHAEFQVGEFQAAVLFRDGDGRPAHFRHALVQLGVEGRAAFQHRAHGARRTLVPEKSRRLFAQQVLLIREFEIHARSSAHPVFFRLRIVR